MMENFGCANKAGWQIHNLSTSESPHIFVFDGGTVGRTLECASESVIQGPSLLGVGIKGFPAFWKISKEVNLPTVESLGPSTPFGYQKRLIFH